MGTRHTGRSHARPYWALALAVLLPGLGAAVVGTSASAAPGAPATVTLALSPSSIRADSGTSTSTATATVKDSNGVPLGLQSVSFGTNGDVTFNSTTATTAANGTASVTIHSSSTADVETITASSGGHSGTAQLTEFSAANSVTVTLNPSTITANGTATTTATANVTDVHGSGVTDDTVAFSNNGGDTSIGSTVTNHHDGTYSVTITASTTADVEQISASTEGKTSPQVPLTEVAGPATTVTVDALNPMTADGVATQLVTAHVKDANTNPVKTETVKFTTNGDVTIGSTTNHNDGTYTATITASKTADTETITATAQTANKTGTATLVENPGPATQVTVNLNPSSIQANGSATSTATATVKDANNNFVKDETVAFTTNGDVTIGSTTNHNDGTYTATITASMTAGGNGDPDPETIMATTSKHATVSGSAALTEYGSAGSTTLQLTPSLIPADGASHSAAKATVLDAHGNGVPGVSVQFGTTGDVTFSSNVVVTGADGTASTTITASNTADQETISATGGGHTATAQLTESGPATKVVLGLQPSSFTADGSSTSAATATVTDANNNPVPNETLSITTNGDVTISAVTNHSDGTYTATITASTTADVETITATATKANKTDQKPLTETPGPVNSVSVALNPASITADGTSTSTATATVTDSHGNGIKGETVAFSTNGDASVGAPTDNQNGTYKATITASTTADQETITATDSAAGKSGTATLTETAGPAASVTLGLNPPSVIADGSSTSVATATVKDAHNNAVANTTVTITTNGDASVGAVTNNHDGTYTATITASKTADSETITASTANGKTNSATLTENAGPPVLNLTLAPSSIPADGKSTSTATATVKDANGNPYPSETVTIATNGDTSVGSVTNNGGGTYTATITASTTADQETITASDSAKSLTKTATLTETASGTGFHATSPTRILDTRTDPAGPLGPNSTRKVQVAGAQGSPVPATHVSAVVMNLTATQPSMQTYLTVFPSGSPPTASNLNIPAGRDAANLVTVQLAPDGSVQLYNAQGTVNAIFDVVGYFDDGTMAGASHYVALNPSRVDDTRTANGGGRLGASSTRKIQVTGAGNVPALHVTAVIVNLTGVSPSTGTYLTLFPSGSPPNASNVNLQPGEIRPNLVMVPLASDGSVMLYNAAGTTDAILDVAGYFDDGTVPTAKGFTPAPPGRILDTRTTDPPALGAPDSPNPRTIQVTGIQGGPPAGSTAAVINVTATQATAGTFITVFPSNPMPTVSNLNVPPGLDIPNLSVDTLASDGSVQLFNAQGTVHVIFDVAGWFG